MESMGKIWGVEAVRGRRCADQAGMPPSRERLVLHLSKKSSIRLLTSFAYVFNHICPSYP
jgi:hypothetical protein